MHSRVFQITSKPVPVEARLAEDLIPEDFFITVDYVAEQHGEARKSSINWLQECIGDYFSFYGEQLIAQNNVHEYFRENYRLFLAKLEKLRAVTFEQFAGAAVAEPDTVELLLFSLGTLYSNKWGIHIYQSDDIGCDAGVLMTLQDWIRTVSPGQKFYIGGVFDYHV